MPTLLNLETVTQNSTLTTIFASAVKRAAALIVAADSPAADQIDWAKRAHYEFMLDRAAFYATRILEGELAETASFRTLIDAFIANEQGAPITDATVVPIVNKWMLRFAAKAI